MIKDTLYKAVVVGLLGFTAYNSSVTAGNTTASNVVQTTQADMIIKGIEAFSPALMAADHAGWLQSDNKATAAAGRASWSAMNKDTFEPVAVRERDGWHYNGKILNGEDMMNIINKTPQIRLVRNYHPSDAVAVQHAQSAHKNRDQTSCADLVKFDKAGIELTPPQAVALNKCRLHATVHNNGSTDYHTQPTLTYKGYGVTVKRTGDQVYVDGHAAALDEVAESGKVFSSGLYQIVFYNSGKVTLLKNKVFVGYLKRG